jgi:hypothetical protein
MSIFLTQGVFSLELMHRPLFLAALRLPPDGNGVYSR